MLQLILSMTQKLGPSIMSKVTQIIGLANNILEHQVAGQSEGRDREQNGEEDDEGEADIEILGLVLTLLSAILNGNQNRTVKIRIRASKMSITTNFHILFFIRKRELVTAGSTLAGVDSHPHEAAVQSPSDRNSPCRP